MSPESVYYLFRQFKTLGRENVTDAPGRRRPITARTDENIQAVRDIIEGDRRASAKGIALSLGTSRPVVQDIIHQELGLQKVKARWVPKLQSTWDKTIRRLWTESFLQKYEGDWSRFKRRFITCDET